jgi:hypothetical protein
MNTALKICSIALLLLPSSIVTWLMLRLLAATFAARKEYKVKRDELDQDSAVVQFWKKETERLVTEHQAHPCQASRDRLAVAYRRHQMEFQAFSEKYKHLLDTEKPSGPAKPGLQ